MSYDIRLMSKIPWYVFLRETISIFLFHEWSQNHEWAQWPGRDHIEIDVSERSIYARV